MRGDQHRDRAALDEEREDRPADEHQAECRDEGGERDRFGGQRVGDPREHVAEAALEQRGGIAADERRNENRRADERHEQQQLEGRLRRELDDDRRPVGGGEERAALQQVLQIHIDFTITASTAVYSVDDEWVVTPRFRKTYLLVAAGGHCRGAAHRGRGRPARAPPLRARRPRRVARIETRARSAVQPQRRGAGRHRLDNLANQRDLIRNAGRRRGRRARAVRGASNARAPPGRPRPRASAFTTRPASRSRGPGVFRICRPNARRDRPRSFVAPDALGLRLVRVQPVVDRARGPAAARLGSVVVGAAARRRSRRAGGGRHVH